jgi:signal transduction histidine kinase
MNSIQLDITPYTINAVSLVIIGLASIVYLLRLKEKSATTRMMILGLASFTVSMVTMFLSGIVLWGSAMGGLTDACSVVSMAAMVEFACRFPQNATTLASRVVRGLSWGVSLVALGISGGNAVQILALHNFSASIPVGYWLLNPLTFLVALGVSVYRTVAIQPERLPGLTGAWSAFFRPQNRPARVLRNFSMALSIGLVQGIVSGVGLPGIFPSILGPILINLSLLLMLAAVVYASFDFTAQQPSLVVRLVGLSLVPLLAVLGVIAIYDAYLTAGWIVDQNASIVENTQKALHAGRPEDVPAEVVYILSWPQAGGAASQGRLVTARQPGFDPQPLLQENATAPISAIWPYSIEASLRSEAAARAQEIHLRYGDHPPGSYYQYVGFAFDQDGARYEIGFSLAELSRITQGQNIGMIWGILLAALTILFVFPLFFRENLIRPLDRLLTGVRRADAGDLEGRVAVTHNDEVGYLTAAFNNMASSLKRELDGRQSAEAELRQLNLTLEERVSKRTRELEALYDVTAASSQARDPERLLAVLLERSLSAMSAQLGFILLIEEHTGARQIRLAASQALPEDWLSYFAALRVEDDWVLALTGQSEPVLIADSCDDERTPAFMQPSAQLALILAPLQAEGRTLGILGMARPVAERFDLDEVALLVSIVNQVGVAVHAEGLRQLVQQASVLEERQRLARDLHDSVTQSLYGLLTLTEVGLMRVEANNLEASAETYRKIRQSARQAIREMRLFIHQLRPPVLEQEGLAGALDLRLAAVEGRSDVHARLIADEDIRLPLPVETALYHIAQEALNNALKHARAANVTVSLARLPGGVILEVVDDGCGFDLPQEANGGMGLGNMRARAEEIGARLEITTRPGQGTRVSVCLEEQA